MMLTSAAMRRGWLRGSQADPQCLAQGVQGVLRQ